LGRGWRPYQHCLVSLAHMQRLGIGLGIDRDCRDPHPPRRADDAAGDLAAVGDQDLLEHRRKPPLTLSLSPRTGRGNAAEMPCEISEDRREQAVQLSLYPPAESGA